MERVETPPFWQPSATATWRRRRRSAPILHSSLILILLPCLSLIFFLFIVVPSIPKFVPQNIDNKSNNTPTSFPIKKSWQSLNVVLVVFAILCGVFARRNDDVSVPENHHLNHHHRGEERIKSGDQINAGSQQWYGYSEQRISSPLTPVTGISRLRRTVSELPPSQGFQWETGNDKLRFFDDFDVSNYYPVTPSHVIHHRYHHVIPEINRTEPEIDEPKVKEIPVDNFVLETRGELPSPTISPPPTPPPRSLVPPPPPPPPPRQMSNKKPKRTFQNLPRTPPPPPPPPPPPQQPPSMASPYGGWREKKRRSSRKRINATKEIANAIASLYNNKRKRKLKSRQSYENPLVVESESPATPAPPPPPPPPPPPSIFHSLFRKGSKTKKIHSLSSIPDPPTLPRRKPVNPAGKPPLPTNSGNQSPLITPPATPLKVTEMKFVMRGSREVEEVDGREMNGEDEEREGKGEPSMTSSSSVTCPSPDVNAKADNFIARLHDGWRLEKLNSWREKHQSGPRPIV